jgi:hypothetical protein
MIDARPGEKRTVPSGGAPVVEDGTAVRQKIAVDIPVRSFVGALAGDAGITGCSEVTNHVGGCTLVLLARRVVHAR